MSNPISLNEKISQVLISEDLSDDDRTFLHLEIKALIEAEKQQAAKETLNTIAHHMLCIEEVNRGNWQKRDIMDLKAILYRLTQS